jgi:hypothetical protein
MWPEAELGEIVPEHILKHFHILLYGNIAPAPDDKPKIRSSTLYFAKKAISFFLPWNPDDKWNNIAKSGNPTTSKEIHKLLLDVKRMEVRKQYYYRLCSTEIIA